MSYQLNYYYFFLPFIRSIFNLIIYYSKDTSVKAGDDRSWIKFTGNDTGLVPNSGVGSTNQLSIKNDFQN